MLVRQKVVRHVESSIGLGLLLVVTMAAPSAARPVTFTHLWAPHNNSPIVPPVDFSVRFTTPLGQQSLTIPGIEHYATGTAQQLFVITPANAAVYGVDFAAWAALLPATGRGEFASTFGDRTHTANPNLSQFPVFELKSIGLAVHNFGLASPIVDDSLFLNFFVTGDDGLPVPEPGGLVLTMVAVLMVHGGWRARF